MSFPLFSFFPKLLCPALPSFSQVFLFGDLNYRLTGLDVNENLAAIARKDFGLLVKFDEVGTNVTTSTLDITFFSFHMVPVLAVATTGSETRATGLFGG